MDLKKDGFELVSVEEFEKIKKIKNFVETSRIFSSLAATWRKMDELQKLLKDFPRTEVKI